MITAKLDRRSWLRRTILVQTPEGRFAVEYDGRGFGGEAVSVDGRVADRQTSGLWFAPRFRLRLGKRPAELEVRFWPWIALRSLTLSVDGKEVYSWRTPQATLVAILLIAIVAGNTAWMVWQAQAPEAYRAGDPLPPVEAEETPVGPPVESAPETPPGPEPFPFDPDKHPGLTSLAIGLFLVGFVRLRVLLEGRKPRPSKIQVLAAVLLCGPFGLLLAPLTGDMAAGLLRFWRGLDPLLIALFLSLLPAWIGIPLLFADRAQEHTRWKKGVRRRRWQGLLFLTPFASLLTVLIRRGDWLDSFPGLVLTVMIGSLPMGASAILVLGRTHPGLKFMGKRL